MRKTLLIIIIGGAKAAGLLKEAVHSLGLRTRCLVAWCGYQPTCLVTLRQNWTAAPFWLPFSGKTKQQKNPEERTLKLRGRFMSAHQTSHKQLANKYQRVGILLNWAPFCWLGVQKPTSCFALPFLSWIVMECLNSRTLWLRVQIIFMLLLAGIITHVYDTVFINSDKKQDLSNKIHYKTMIKAMDKN